MNIPDELERAYHIFDEIEDAEWGTGTIAEIQRHTWRKWYKLSFLQYLRLASECASGSRESIGGLPRLEKKVAASLADVNLDCLSPFSFGEGQNPSAPVITPRPDLGQLVCDEESRTRIASIIHNDFPFGARVAMLGDDDLIATTIAHKHFPVTVLDVDTRIAEVVSMRDFIQFINHDVREPWRHESRFEAVVLDPADGSIALEAWTRRANECLSNVEGARAYLSVNTLRLGRRWSRLLDELGLHNLTPVAHYPRVKVYPGTSERGTTTDLWVFERMTRPSELPQPYLEIEVFR